VKGKRFSFDTNLDTVIKPIDPNFTTLIFVMIEVSFYPEDNGELYILNDGDFNC
jgi:hypothetical protein